MLTCKDFLNALNEYLDETEDAEIRQDVEQHCRECPNCHAIFDTTKKTLQFFKGTEPHPMPAEAHNRLMDRLQKRMAQESIKA